MMNKILLAIIGLGLWANVVVNVTRPAKADSDYYLQQTERNIRSISSDIGSIQGGTCVNSKLC